MELESGSYVIGEIINADYKITARVRGETPNLLWVNTRKHLHVRYLAAQLQERRR